VRLSRLIYGTRISLSVGFLGAFIAFILGVTYGIISGFYGGQVDEIMMRIVDIFYAFPTFFWQHKGQTGDEKNHVESVLPGN
jgi:ABC-type dipeptide/oligopeptide/nickel transport system permease subunit